MTHALQRCCDSGGSGFHPALVQGRPGCHGAHLLIGRVLQPLQHHLETVAVTRGKAFHHTTDVCLLSYSKTVSHLLLRVFGVARRAQPAGGQDRLQQGEVGHVEGEESDDPQHGRHHYADDGSVAHLVPTHAARAERVRQPRSPAPYSGLGNNSLAGYSLPLRLQAGDDNVVAVTVGGRHVGHPHLPLAGRGRGGVDDGRVRTDALAPNVLVVRPGPGHHHRHPYQKPHARGRRSDQSGGGVGHSDQSGVLVWTTSYPTELYDQLFNVHIDLWILVAAIGRGGREKG